MIAKISKGGRIRGLLEYLYGPGRFEEHTEPHLVAGFDEPAALEPPVDEDGRPQLEDLAASLNAPQIAAGRRGLPKYVWQCALSLAPEDRALTDAEWRAIAERFIEGMGFGELRWVAVHHGLSVNGNQHIHLAVTLATEDGDPVWLQQDYRRAQQVVADIEREFDLVQRCRRGNTATREAASAAEFARARDAGQSTTDREVLRRQVRAAAGAATDEASWIAGLKRAGLLIAPRTPEGSPQVIGYAVAARPAAGARPVWYAGHTLDADLGLGRLRARWPGTRPLSAAEWAAIPAESPPASDTTAQDPAARWRASAAALAEVSRQLAALPPDAPDWDRLALATADTLAGVAALAEPSGRGPVSRAADILARAAAPPRRALPTELSPRGTVLVGALTRISLALALSRPARDLNEALLVLAIVAQSGRLVQRMVELRLAQHDAAAAGAAREAAARMLPLLSRAVDATAARTGVPPTRPASETGSGDRPDATATTEPGRPDRPQPDSEDRPPTPRPGDDRSAQR